MDLIPSAEVAKKIGRIAQLEERCPYKAEVTGSIPVPPTIRLWKTWYAETGEIFVKEDVVPEVQDLIDDHKIGLSF